ncbi:SCO family protein [Methylobacterium sp. EM32]|uniref:SCO family protein n=1 Tax=Methylobacterium sp. EM32 TaxID=3163481 RepID=UPI0033AA1010
MTPSPSGHAARASLALVLALAAVPATGLTLGVTARGGAGGAAAVVATDAELRDTRSRPVRFRSDVLGRGVTLVSFTLVGCQVQCPLSDHRMNLVEDALAARGRGDVRLVTLTINPDNRPEDLRRHAEQFGPGPSRTFLTGVPDQLYPLLDGLGMVFGNAADHPLFFLVFDAAGRAVARIPEDRATPEALTAAVLAAAR